MAPGVQVAQISAHEWAISIRGFNSIFADKLLVLIDGRSVYTPMFAGAFGRRRLLHRRRFSYGVMTGRGVELDGTFDGTWAPSSGAVDLSFKGEVKVVFNFSLKDVIRGRIDPTGQGSGTFEGTGAAGVERGTWTCVLLVSPQVAAL